jgi:hypothetical protein
MKEDEALEANAINGRNILRRYIRTESRDNEPSGLEALVGYF